MSMQPEKGINRELGLGEAISKTFQVFRRDFSKYFVLYAVVGIIVIIASLIFGAITSPFGIAGTIVNGILTALYQPLFPILLAVYYYSNLARTAQAQAPPAQMPMAPTTPLQAGMKLCPICGAQNFTSASFCTKCGAKLN